MSGLFGEGDFKQAGHGNLSCTETAAALQDNMPSLLMSPVEAIGEPPVEAIGEPEYTMRPFVCEFHRMTSSKDEKSAGNGGRCRTAIVVDRSAIQRTRMKEPRQASVHNKKSADGVGRP